MMLHLNPSRRRKAAARKSRTGKEAPVARRKSPRRKSVRSRARSIAKATKKARRRRARSYGVGGFRPGMILKREMLETAAGGVIGATLPGALIDRFGSSLPAQLQTANVRPWVDAGGGVVLATVASKFNKRLAMGIALGSVINLGVRLAAPFIRKSVGLSGYFHGPAGVPLMGMGMQPMLAGDPYAVDWNAESRMFASN